MRQIIRRDPKWNAFGATRPLISTSNPMVPQAISGYLRPKLSILRRKQPSRCTNGNSRLREKTVSPFVFGSGCRLPFAFKVSAQDQIRQQAVHSAFSAKSAFFVTAKRTGGIEFVVGVRPNDTRAKFAHDLENLAALVCPNAGAQTVRRIVCTFDRFF